MKRCPRCNQVYGDDNLNFCLADGAPLSHADTSKATVSISPPLSPPSPAGAPSESTQASRRGVSPVLAYAVVGLLIVLIGGGIVVWLKPDAEPSRAESQGTAPPNTASPTPSAPRQVPVPKLYRVVGVAEDDVLYVRGKPGPQNAHVGMIPANGVDIQILDGAERVGQSTWVRVNYKGLTGWVNRRFLAEQ